VAQDDEIRDAASGDGEDVASNAAPEAVPADPDDLELVKKIARGEALRFKAERFKRRGGMGLVSGVHDLLLDRPLVRKRPRRKLRAANDWRAFVYEAQVTAQLNHPAIVPLFDLGYDKAGFYYLMPRVQGTTLHKVLTQLASEDDETILRYPMTRLLNIFRTVCGAVAHAHQRDIVHRDIKPDQVLLGEHDEVLLTDWGLAAQMGRVRSEYVQGTSIGASAGTIRSGQTVLDGVHGAPRYQPPERLEAGRSIPAHYTQDVYSLGAVLYHLLTLRAPVDPPRDPGIQATDPAYLVFIRRQVARLEPPSRRRWSHTLDPIWDKICMRCLSVSPADRYGDAGELFRAVEDALTEADERRRNRERAARALADGARAVRELDAVSEDLFGARVILRSLTAAVAPFQRAQRREELWAAEDDESRLARNNSELLAEAERAYEVALTIDPNNLEARSSLADLYMDRVREAEAAGDGPAAAYFLLRMGRFDDGTRASLLRRNAEVRLEGLPANATVRVAPLEERNRRLLPGQWRSANIVSGAPVHLEPGRHSIEITAPGRATGTYCLLVDPGESVSLSPRLARLDQVPDGYVYVPAGPGRLEGDPLSTGCGPKRSVTMGDFGMAVYPVTMAEYREFLDDVPAGEARRRVPLNPVDDDPLFQLEGGAWSIPERDAHGDPVHPEMPVLLVRAEDAEAYAAWLSRRRDRIYRLPTRDEWEYAARGGDGRLYPWGDYPEPTFAWGREPQRGRPVPAPVGRCPEDCSPFGVRDLAGGVGDWLADDFTAGGAQRHVGGGSWFASTTYQRLARRFGLDPSHRSAGVGFRLLLEI
jgi:serine/threonine-protein kinase